MTLSELTAQVALGEDSRRQFKQDRQSPDALAAEMAAFANFEGGVISLGVTADSSLPGLSPADVSRLNQLISTVAAQHVCSPLTVQTANVALKHGRLVADFCPLDCYTCL
jgi:ATP-dependent DNA helicase RecG